MVDREAETTHYHTEKHLALCRRHTNVEHTKETIAGIISVTDPSGGSVFPVGNQKDNFPDRLSIIPLTNKSHH